MAKATIMIVEDESIVAEDIRFSLEANGYDVCGICSSGEDALAQAGRLQPDLILMDIQLQGSLDGTETARLIWEQYGIPIVYLTAHSDEATLGRAKWTRPQGYLLKPFEERELCVTVEIALSKRPLAPMLELPCIEWYAALQTALAEGASFFSRESAAGAELRDSAGKVLARARLNPRQSAQVPSENFGDLSADILDIALAIWLQQRDGKDEPVLLRADDCLAFRGLKQQKSGSGARAGYADKWRKEVAAQITLLASIELRSEAGGDLGPLLEIAAAEGVYAWMLRPGDWVAGTGRTTLFSKRILEYDPYRQKWEKRLARRLCWQWAQGVTEPVTIEALLAALQLPVDAKNPIRTKERLELALETLARDQLIGHWEYLGPDPDIVGKRGWLSVWMSWPLRIEAPPGRISSAADTAPKPLASAERQRSFGFLKHIRAERGLSQADVAAAIGLTQAQLSHIEAGSRVQAATAEKIKAWILAQL